MKYIIFLLIITFTSCGPEAEMFQRQYVIENNSSVPIELQFYRNGELAFRFGKSILQNGELLEGLILDRSGGPWSELTTEQLSDAPTNSFETDSVRLVFNNQKLSIFKEVNSSNGIIFSPSNRNILRDSDYFAIDGDKFLFTISEDDFDNATDCNGDCN